MIQKKIQFGLIFITLILVGFIYYWYSPTHYQFFPKCVFKSVTGLSCPGCGAQRATHELLHFNIAKAFSYNALLVVALPFTVVALIYYNTSLRNRFPKLTRFFFGRHGIMLLLIIVLLFFILRNL